MHRKFDNSFKIMAVDLRVVKGFVAEVAKELYIDPSLLSKWRLYMPAFGISEMRKLLNYIRNGK